MNHIKRNITALALCIIALGTSAQTLTLKQCLALAADHSLTLKQADAQVERARVMQGTAWDLDRTELSLSQDPTSGGSPDNALALSQEIEFPTVYAARHSQLKAETKAEKSRRNVTLQQLHSDIASAYWQLVYCKERITILSAQDSVLTRYADLADKRYKAGEARQLEALTAARLERENAMELAAAKSYYAAGQQQLAALIGTDAAITPADNTLSALDYSPTDFSFASTAEGELARDRVAVADKALRVAKNGYAPSLSLVLKNQLVISSWDPYHENRARYDGGNFMGFEVGIGIPLFFGATKAKVKAARSDRAIAQMEMQQQQLTQQTEYKAALTRYNTAFSRMQYYEQKGAASATEIERLASLEYENGEISYIEYVSALQESIDSQLKRADAINAYNQAVVALKRICGTAI